MESPFYPNGITGPNSSFTIFLEPIYDSFSQTYMNIITLSCMPDGPLKSMVKLMSFPKLSPFICYTDGLPANCSFVLMRYPVSHHNSYVHASDRTGMIRMNQTLYTSSNLKKETSYMFADDITALFAYLLSHGYTIDTSISKLLKNSGINGVSNFSNGNGNRRFICIATFLQ